MGEAIGQMLPTAVGVAVSPMPIVAVVLMLVTPRARSNGPAFIVGWLVGIGVVGGIILALAPSTASDNGQPATWISVIELVLGLLLLLLAVKQWRGRPQGDEEAATPKWMGALDDFTPVKSSGAGVILSIVNPKNLLLVIAGAAAIAATGITGGQQAVAWLVFTLIATIGVGVPVVIYFALGDGAAALLDRLKNWLARNNGVIMAVLFLIIGAKLIGNAISGFSS
jgi:threonine/homoserine/homoserine lactone efflux protein